MSAKNEKAYMPQEILWLDDFTHSKNETDLASETCSHSYITKKEGFVKPPWDLYSDKIIEYVQNLARISQQTLSISNYGESYYKITVGYSVADSESEGESTENQVREGVSIQTNTSYSDEPILSCWYLRNPDGSPKISQADAIFFSLYCQNALTLQSNGKYSLAFESDNFTGYIDPPNNVPWFWAYLVAGFRTISTPQTTTTISYTTDKPSIEKLDAVGYISEMPNGLEEIDGYKIDYLLTSYRVSKAGKKRYRVEETFLQSQQGGWNIEIYTPPNP